MHYTGTIWRPPYEASSLLLEVTAGCTHHKCKFCTLYNDLSFKFRMSPMEDVECDLQEVASTLKQWDGFRFNRAFLTGANPFVLKAERLLSIASLIRKYVPTVQTIGCFARVTDIILKSDSGLIALAQAGYDSLTIGIETGDDEALHFMNKGYTSADVVEQCSRLDKMGIGYNFFYLVSISGTGRGEIGAKATAMGINGLSIGTESGDNETLRLANKGYTADDILEQCKKLDEAGIEYYFVYMTGLAGKGNGYRNAVNSAKLFSQLNPYFISVDSLTLFPDTELYAMAQRGEFIPADEKERLEELQVFVSNLQIRTHLLANSVSNYHPLTAYLPYDRQRVVGELQYILDTRNEAEMKRFRAGLKSLGKENPRPSAKKKESESISL